MKDKNYTFVENTTAKLQVLEEGLEDTLLQHMIYAKMIKGLYDNYIEAGFSEEQAMYMITKESGSKT